MTDFFERLDDLVAVSEVFFHSLLNDFLHFGTLPVSAQQQQGDAAVEALCLRRKMVVIVTTISNRDLTIVLRSRVQKLAFVLISGEGGRGVIGWYRAGMEMECRRQGISMLCSSTWRCGIVILLKNRRLCNL
jgi:hypothetical protein